MLARLGIDSMGPHQIEVMRMVKHQKRADGQARTAITSGLASMSGRKGLSRAATTPK
jgi:hypothetical protein